LIKELQEKEKRYRAEIAESAEEKKKTSPEDRPLEIVGAQRKEEDIAQRKRTK